MYTLYYSPGACSLAAHAVLEEIGVRYEAKEQIIGAGQTATKEFLELNPKAGVPVFVDGDHIITECTAILTYLAEKHPQAGLIPESGSIGKARCLEWLSFVSSTIHPLYWGIWRPYRLSSDKRHHDEIYRTTKHGLKDQYALIDAHLAYGSYLLGDHSSIADFYLFVFTHWAYRIGLPVAGWPNLNRFFETMAMRASVRRAVAKEGIQLPGELVA